MSTAIQKRTEESDPQKRLVQILQTNYKYMVSQLQALNNLIFSCPKTETRIVLLLDVFCKWHAQMPAEEPVNETVSAFDDEQMDEAVLVITEMIKTNRLGLCNPFHDEKNTGTMIATAIYAELEQLDVAQRIAYLAAILKTQHIPYVDLTGFRPYTEEDVAREVNNNPGIFLQAQSVIKNAPSPSIAAAWLIEKLNEVETPQARVMLLAEAIADGRARTASASGMFGMSIDKVDMGELPKEIVHLLTMMEKNLKRRGSARRGSRS